MSHTHPLDYYFLFTHGLDQNNLARYELAALLGKQLRRRIEPAVQQHNALGAKIRLPRALSDTELRELFYLAGYLQYAGPVLLCQPWSTVTEQVLCEAIARHIAANTGPVAPVPVLLAATVEGFPDRWPYRLPGVTGSRFYREKYHFADQPVAGVFRRIGYPGAPSVASPLGDRIAGVVDSLERLEQFLDYLEANDLKERGVLCLHLFRDFLEPVDSAATAGFHYPGSQRDTLLVLIESRYSAKNMVHLFDDDKPYWPNRITTPPRLVAAGLNLTRIPLPGPGPDAPRPYLVLDPFVGTGTTAIEVSKYPVSFVGSDIEPPEGVLDNLSFYLDFDDQQIRHLVHAVERRIVNRRDPFLMRLVAILSCFCGGQPDFRSDPSLSDLMSILRDDSRPFPPDRNSLLAGLTARVSPQRDALTLRELLQAFREDYPLGDFVNRYLIYQVYRVLRQHYVDCTFSNDHVDHALVGERFGAQWGAGPQNSRQDAPLRQKLELMASQLEAVATSGGDRSPYAVRLRRGVPFRPHRGATRPVILQRDLRKTATLGREAMLHALELPNSHPGFDLVLTDLPYAVNTKVADLPGLYDAFFDLCARLVRPGGELLLFTLHKVRSGQQVPPEAHAELVEDRLLQRMTDNGRVVTPATESIDGTGRPAVLYWKSHKALNRIVLHYRVGDSGEG